MKQTHFIQHLYQKFFPKVSSKNIEIAKQWQFLSPLEKKELAKDFLQKGERKLLNRDITALDLFDKASTWLFLSLTFFQVFSDFFENVLLQVLRFRLCF